MCAVLCSAGKQASAILIPLWPGSPWWVQGPLYLWVSKKQTGEARSHEMFKFVEKTCIWPEMLLDTHHKNEKLFIWRITCYLYQLHSSWEGGACPACGPVCRYLSWSLSHQPMFRALLRIFFPIGEESWWLERISISCSFTRNIQNRVLLPWKL